MQTNPSGWIGVVATEHTATYLRAASNRGDLESTFRFVEPYFVGPAMARDHRQAERLFILAAEWGHAEAQAMLGAWSLSPDLSHLSEEMGEALRWLERVAEQGELYAMKYLGPFYVEYGRRAELQDVLCGVSIFRHCTEQTLHGACTFVYATAPSTDRTSNPIQCGTLSHI